MHFVCLFVSLQDILRLVHPSKTLIRGSIIIQAAKPTAGLDEHMLLITNVKQFCMKRPIL